MSVAAGGQSVFESVFAVMMFLLAGLLVGGVWSAYQRGSRTVTAILAVLAAMALALAGFTLLGAM